MFPHHRVVEPMIGLLPLGGWLWLLVLVAIVALVSWLVASLVMRRGGGSASSGGSGGAGSDEADTILRARLARGEISTEEYTEARRVLGLR